MHRLEHYKNRPLSLVDIKSPPSLETSPAEVHIHQPVHKQPSRAETNISTIEKVVETPSEEAKHQTYKLRGEKLRGTYPN